MSCRILLTSVSLLTFVPSIANAQSAPNEEAETAAPDENVIIVTGEKTERTMQETTASVAVTTARRIEEENIQSISEVFQRTANVTDTSSESVFSIRGISSNGVSGGGASPLSTVYVDGAALPNDTLYGAPTGTWDIAQIEILRGPQSTLQGLNALAGSIILKSREPTWSWTARARVIADDAGSRSLAIAGGGPIIEDELAFRITAEKKDEDGFIFNPTTGEDFDTLDLLNIRGRLLWEPSDLPGFRALVGYSHTSRAGRASFSYSDLSEPDYFNNRLNYSNDPAGSEVDTGIATVDLAYEISDTVSVASVSSWTVVDQHRSFDSDQGPTSEEFGDQFSNFETLTEELRFNYESDRFAGLVGLFYYNRQVENEGFSRTDIITPQATISGLLQGGGLDAATSDYIAGLYVMALPSVPVNFEYNSPSSGENIALFADMRWEALDGFNVIGGFRYDRQTHIIDNNQFTTFEGTFPDPAAFAAPNTPLFFAIAGINQGVQQLVDNAATPSAMSERTFEAFLPKAGFSYDWAEDFTTSFVVQRGYRAGGSSINTARATNFDYDPEFSWNYELSLRSQWFDEALTVNANVFYVDWKEQQISANFGLNAFDSHIVNAGKSHLYGFELELSHRISRNFNWYASAGHVRTEFDEFDVIDGAVTADFTGSEFADAPHWTLSGGANLRWGEGFSANLNANYRSSVFNTIGTNQGERKVPARTLVNGRVGYEGDNWQIYVFGNNIFNAFDARFINQDFGLAIVGAPRVFGVGLETEF